MDAERTNLLTEAERLGFPYAIFGGGGLHLAGEQSWRRKLPDAMAADLPGIKAQLEAHAVQHDRAAAFEASEAAREGRMVEREGPPTTDEARAAAATRAEAAEAVARHRAAQGERVEALLVRIAQALEKR